MAVAIILLLAATFRFYGQDWDAGNYFHPDERFIATVVDGRLSVPAPSEFHLLFDPANSPLNTRSDDEAGSPREFAYGSLPFLIATFLGGLIGIVTDTDLTSYSNVGQFGRFLTALVDLGTVSLVILFARRTFGEGAALVAGLLTAASVILIQLAHFFTVDTWVTFLTMATLYACLRVTQNFSLRWSLTAAAFGGAALATKVSVGVLGIPVLLALWIGARAVSNNWQDTSKKFATRLTISALPTLAVFATFEPYAIWRPGPFIDDIRTQWEIVNGLFDVPFTRQFVGTISGLNEIENLVLWGVAPGFGIAAVVVTLISIYRATTTRDPRYLLLLSWIIPYFYIIASSEARFLRYSAPLVPALAILVGHELTAWWGRSDQKLGRRILPAVSITTITGITLVWAVAFMNVYAGTHPRVDASAWIYENVPPGSVITHEIWDDRLPVAIGTTSGGIYQYRGLDLYSDRPNDEAIAFIADFLDDADIIVLASQRLSHSIPRLPWRYPVQSEYYRLLEQERLGFELAYEATNFPGFGQFRVNTLAADESFSVYDHPPVRIFRKVDDLSADEIELRFARAAAQPRVPLREPPEPTLRLASPVQERSVNPEPGWSSAATSFTPIAIGVWLAAIVLIALLSVPVALRLFPAFADLGIGFSPLIGLLAIGMATWLIWSLQLAMLSLTTVLIAVAVVATLTWGAAGLNSRWRQTLRERRSTIIASIVTFSVVFSVFLVIRAINPDLWHPFYGGEKPMDTAYLNAIARTGAFPPHDPWFSDGWVNYYYYGFFLLTLLWTLTGIQVDVAYQLSLATIAGLFASGLFSLGSTLTRSLLQTRTERWLIAGGAVTTVVVIFTGNVHTLIQMIRNATLDADFWDSTRIVDFAINEFPYFTLLYGDVHAHLIAAPVLVLVVALGYSWVESSVEWPLSRIFLWTLAAAVAAGAIAAINTWDAPTAAVVLAAAMVFALIRDARLNGRRWIMSAAVAGLVATIAYLLFAPFFNNFVTQTDGFEMTNAGTGVTEWAMHFGGLLIPIALVGGISVFRHVLSRDLNAGLLVYGATLTFAMYLVGAMTTGEASSGFIQFVITGALLATAGALVSNGATGVQTRRYRELSLLAMFPFLTIAGLLAPVRPVAAISSIIVAVFLVLFTTNPNRSAAILLAILGAAGAGLVLVADVILVVDHLHNSDWERMNTVFKLYFQSWTLLGIVTAAATMWLAHWTHRAVRSNAGAYRTSIGTHALLPAGMAIVTIAVVLAWFAYPMFATSDRLGHRMESSPTGLSLAGYQWMNGGTIQNQAGETINFTGDFHSIQWLLREAGGNPVILEASIGPYRGGGSRYSSATGMPTVLGWDGHQSQQRGSIDVARRLQDVRELYRIDDLDRKRHLLRRYGVDYVVVGDVERYTILGSHEQGDEPDYYSTPSGLAAFDEMVGQDLEIAFQSHGTTIYRVLPFPRAGDSR